MPNKVAYTFVGSDLFSSVGKKIDKVSKKLRRQFKGLTKDTDALGRSSRRTSGSMKKMGGGLGFKKMLGIAAVTAGVTKFITTGSRFEDSLADLSAITGTTGKDLNFLREQSLSLGKDARISADEVAVAFKDVASAKSELLKDPKALSTITEQILLLKNATGLELTTATNAALVSMNQFSAGADQAGRFINVLAAGSKIGASEVGDTAEAVKKSGVAAQLAGLEFEELNSLIQVLAKGGLKASNAGTLLSTTLLRLETSRFKELKPSVVGISNVLDTLAAANLDAAQMKALFGEEAIKVAGILIRETSTVREWTGALTGTNIAAEQAAIRMGTLSSKFKGLGVNIEANLIKAFERLAPSLEVFIGSFNQWISAIGPKQLDAFGKGLGSIVSLFASLFKLATAISPILTPLLSGTATIVGGISQKIGKLVGYLSTAFDFYGRLLGLQDKDVNINGSGIVEQFAKIQFEMVVQDPKGVVESLKTKTQDTAGIMQTGQVMVEGVP